MTHFEDVDGVCTLQLNTGCHQRAQGALGDWLLMASDRVAPWWAVVTSASLPCARWVPHRRSFASLAPRGLCLGPLTHSVGPTARNILERDGRQSASLWWSAMRSAATEWLVRMNEPLIVVELCRRVDADFGADVRRTLRARIRPYWGSGHQLDA